MHKILRWVILGVLIMARGLPDAGNVVKDHSVYGLSDMAELAARLGSPVTFDRYGDILFLEDFERGLNAWTLDRDGVLSSVELSPDWVYQGRLSCLVNSGTGALPRAGITKMLPPVTEQKVGIQATFSIDTENNSLHLNLKYQADDNYHLFALQYDAPTGRLFYADSGGAYTPFATPGRLYDGADNAHHMKLIVDLETRKYVRCYVDNQVFDMGSYSPYSFGGGALPYLRARVQVWGDGTTATEVYIDDVFVTMNER